MMKLSTVPTIEPKLQAAGGNLGWASRLWIVFAIVYCVAMLYLYWLLSASFEKEERFFLWERFSQEAEEARSAGHNSQAVELYTKALEQAQKAGLDTASISTLGCLARSSLAEGHAADAAAALKERVALVRSVYGSAGPEMYYALADYADGCRQSGDLSGAISGYKIAYQLSSQNDRLPFAERSSMLRNYSAVLAKYGDKEEEKKLNLELAELPQPAVEKLPLTNLSRDRRSPYLRDWERLVRLAKTEAKGSQVAAAKAHYRQALELIPKFYAGEDPNNERSNATIACLMEIYQQKNDYSDAAEVFGEFLKQYTAAGGKEDDCVANASRECGIGLWRQKKYPEAIAALNRTLKIQEAAKRKDEFSISWTLHLLAMILDEGGHPQEADKTFDRTVAIRERIFPPDDRGLADSILASGFLKQRMGKDKQAEALMHKALSIYKKRGDMKVSHPGTSCLISIAQIQRGRGEYKKAERTFNEVLQRNQRFFGIDSLENAGVFGELGYIELQTKRPEEAIVTLNRAISIFSRYHRPGDLGAIGIYFMWIGNANCDLKHYGEAREAYLKALEIGKRAWPPNSPQMSELEDALSALKGKLGHVS